MDSSCSISSTMASRRASRNDRTRASDIDVVQDGLGRRRRARLRELDRILHAGLRLAVELLQALVGGDPERLHPLTEDLDGIALHPLLDLFLGAVLGRVAAGVAPEAVGLGRHD